MRLSYATLLFCCLMTTVGFASGLERSANFNVFTSTESHEAREILAEAERLREQIAREWLDGPLPSGVGRTTINLSYGERSTGLTWAVDSPDRRFHTVYLTILPGDMVDHVLAHEIAHVVLATRFPHPNRLPAWLEEGIASRYDNAQRREEREQILQWYGRTGNWPALRPVLRTDNLASDDQTAYALACSAVEFLLDRGGKSRLLEFGEAAASGDLDSALRGYYDLANADAFEKAWRNWVQQQEGGTPRTARRD